MPTPERARRIGLIHATPLAIAPVHQAFAEHWPEARLAGLLDDALAPDLAAAGRLTPAIAGRIIALARYAAGAGADGILFTCSAFGAAIEAAAQALPIPVLKPNEAMFRAALATGNHIALIATFAPSIAGLAREFTELAQAAGRPATLTSHLAEGALAALQAGDTARHDALVADCAGHIGPCDAIMLAQFSTASAQPAVTARTGIPVLTSPHAAVRLLRDTLAG